MITRKSSFMDRRSTFWLPMVIMIFCLCSASGLSTAWGSKGGGGEGTGGGAVQELDLAIRNAVQGVPGVSASILSPELALESLKIIQSIQAEVEDAIQLIQVFSFLNVEFRDRRGMKVRWDLLEDLQKRISIIVDLESEHLEKETGGSPKTFLNKPTKERLFVAAKRYLKEKAKYHRLAMVLTVLHELLVILGFQDEEPNEKLANHGYSLTSSIGLAIPQLLQSDFVIHQLKRIRDSCLNAPKVRGRDWKAQRDRILLEGQTKGLIMSKVYREHFQGNPRDAMTFIDNQVINLCSNLMGN